MLVVDDSAYVRKVCQQMLSRSPFIEVVGTARDGRKRSSWSPSSSPDVVTCDLIMPELDGVGFVREQMARKPVPIVIVSVASESGELVLSALDAGAVDFVQKPTALATERLLEMADELIDKVKARGGAPALRPRQRAPRRCRSHAARSSAEAASSISSCSVFRPAVRRRSSALIPQLPADLPVPLAIVLHMPVGYTELYARKLDELSALNVVEAEDGAELRAGTRVSGARRPSSALAPQRRRHA